MTETNPHIVALRSAEQELRDHDRRIADAAADLKALKADRVEIAARVAQCIDVLCGRATPGLFDAADYGADHAWRENDYGPKGNAKTPEPDGVQYPAHDGWRQLRLVSLGLNEKLLKACKREEVFTVGELHDWIDEENRGQHGGFFGEGVLAHWLGAIGKISNKLAEANAEILYQFFADQGFLGVPEGGAS